MAGEAELSATVQMMKFMSDQINKLLELQKAQAEQQNQLLMTQSEHQKKLFDNFANNPGRKGGWDNVEKFKNIKLFAGEAKEWEEFAMKFRSQAGANDPVVLGILDMVENELKEGELEDLKEATDYALIATDMYTDEVLQQTSMKLYNVLLSITTGEANAVVRRCRGNGLWAWKKLCTTLNPRTLATGIKMISQAVSPNKITHGSRADAAIDAWEHHLSKLSAEYGEVISSKMKVAVLYTMLPKDLQERVLDKCAVNWDGAKEEQSAMIYAKVKEDVKNIAKSRRDMVTPKPMEVDNIQAEWYGWGTSEEWQEEQAPDEGQESTEFDINYVGKGAKGKGKGKCWTCGEAGHRAAECPKGKGKASTWQGKNGGGWYKGGYKGDWKGGKGEGKAGKGGWTSPMPRACFGCGSTAHLLRDCPNNKTTQEIHEVQGEAGGPEVLFIGHTMVQDRQAAWTEVKSRKAPQPRVLGDFVRKPPGLSWRPGLRTGGFKVLEVDEPDEDEAEECNIRCIECSPQVQWRARLPQSAQAVAGKVQKKDKKKDEVMEIRTVDGKPKPKEKKWASLGVGDIVVDSAADESCWPKDQGGAFETRPSTKNIVLRTANGGEMGHYGEKEITIRSGESEEVMGLRFQVTDVRKPLLAVRRLVERGNVVSFGPGPSDNYIQSIETGRKIPMERRGGSFVIKAHFVKEISSTAGVESGFTRRA